MSDLDDVLFPVALTPLSARLNGRDVPVHDRRAVVNTRSGRVLTVIGCDYRIVTHAQALDLGLECARPAFPETTAAEWRVAAIDATASGTTCYIDL